MNPSLETPPPIDVEAELRVCGSVILELARCEELSDLQLAWLGDSQLRLLLGHLRGYAAQHQYFDEVLFVTQLKQAGDLERVGGLTRLAQAIDAVAVAHHARYYADRIRANAQRRALWHIGRAMLTAAHDETADVSKAITTLDQQLLAVDDLSTRLPVQAASQIVPQVIERAHVARQERRGGVEIGIAAFDGVIGGFFPGELIVLAARTSCGKSSLAMQIADHAVSNQGAVIFISLEMSAQALIARTLAGDARVSSTDLRCGTLDDVEFERLLEAGQRVSQLPLFVLDPAHCSVAEVRQASKRLQRTQGLALVVVDYLGLLTPLDAAVPRHQQVGELSRDLKALARDLEVPVLCLAQLNRESESSKTGRPKLSHLRESGNIEQDADVVLFIHRPELANPSDRELKNTAELIVAKNRNGPVGDFELYFDAARTRFTTRELRYAEF